MEIQISALQFYTENRQGRHQFSTSAVNIYISILITDMCKPNFRHSSLLRGTPVQSSKHGWDYGCPVRVNHETLTTLQEHDVVMPSYLRRCDVMKSHRRQYDAVLTSCSCCINEVGSDLGKTRSSKLVYHKVLQFTKKWLWTIHSAKICRTAAGIWAVQRHHGPSAAPCYPSVLYSVFSSIRFYSIP